MMDEPRRIAQVMRIPTCRWGVSLAGITTCTALATRVRTVPMAALEAEVASLLAQGYAVSMEVR